MARVDINEEREERIINEIVVDAYGDVERSLGWYYYIQNQLHFPFTAVCIAKRASSPLKVEEKVKVVGMPDEDDCRSEVFVTIKWKGGVLAVPLMQLEPLGAGEQTDQAVADWHYWVACGYEY